MGFRVITLLNKKRKTFSLFFLLCVCVGCKDAFESAIQQTNTVRNQLGLRKLDSLVQDSTFFVTPFSEENSYFFSKSKNQNPGDSFTKVIYYSNKEKNFTKSLLYKSVDSEITLLMEEDNYKKNVDSFRNAVLSLTHYFKSQETFARIDSLPTQQLKNRNKKVLDKIYQESKKSNGRLCGTGLQEIETKDYPKKLHTITNEEFKKLIPSYTQQLKMK